MDPRAHRDNDGDGARVLPQGVEDQGATGETTKKYKLNLNQFFIFAVAVRSPCPLLEARTDSSIAPSARNPPINK